MLIYRKIDTKNEKIVPDSLIPEFAKSSIKLKAKTYDDTSQFQASTSSSTSSSQAAGHGKDDNNTVVVVQPSDEQRDNQTTKRYSF